MATTDISHHPGPLTHADIDALPEERVAERLRVLANLMDDQYRVPGTNIRFGWDALLSVVPVAGSTAGAAVTAYMVLECVRMGVPKRTLVKMLSNLGVDWVIGSIPLIGWVGDVFFKANKRNMLLAQRVMLETAARKKRERVGA